MVAVFLTNSSTASSCEHYLCSTTGINDLGQITGKFADPTIGGGRFRGFVKDGASFTTFDVPGIIHATLTTEK